MLQAQQQQIIAQHQQFSQAGLLPPLVGAPPPGGQPGGLMPPPQGLQPSYMTSTGPFGQFAAPPPPVGHRRAQSSISGQHHGGFSSSNGQYDRSGNTGHARRHSLALSEAKKAAALAQAKRQQGSGDAESSKQESKPESPSPTLSSSPTSSNAPQPSFKFPSSPDKTSSGEPSSSTYKAHGRSQSFQYPPSGDRFRSNQQITSFQFPAKPETQEYRHERSGSSNYGGGGGYQHGRTGSRNFDSNWRQPTAAAQDILPTVGNQFVPGHRSRGSYGSSISSLSGFSMYPSGSGQLQGQGQQRKSLFAPYLPQASLPGLLEEGRLVGGVLRVNRKNRSDAYVSTDGLLDADIFICGSKDRNRALEGDLVAIELLEVDEVWGSKKEKEEKKKRRDQSMFSDPEAKVEGATGGELRRKGSLKQRPTQKKNDDVEVEGQSLLLVEEEELSDEIKPLYAGHVVAVMDRIAGQMFSGSLGLLRPSSQATKDKQVAERKEKGEPVAEIARIDKPKIVWFKPTDKRVPLIAIPTEQAPRDFVENHEQYANKVFVASIKRWPITSLHPFGTLVEELGNADNLDIQVEAILRDNNFTASRFADSVLKTLPGAEEGMSSSSLELPGHDKLERKDFSHEYVMTFSFTGDISDEAIHLRKLSDTKIELGVHVSDVTHFCKENSPLDREAKKRGSSVFLKQRQIGIFPNEFNTFTSFDVDKVSPTVSVIFEIDIATFDVVDTDICLGLVKPKQRILYDSVQQVLDEKEHTIAQGVVDYIKTLQVLSRRFRQQRLNLTTGETPILGLLNFLEEDNVGVTGNLFDGQQVQQMFDEINVKVNSAIAQKLYAVLSTKAFLRRHSEPILSKLESFAWLVRSLNIDIDSSSSAGLQKSLFQVESDDVRKALETLLYKCMNKAKYFVAGKVDMDNCGHYWLNSPLYTHFNAPLRRYADIIVHRQIKSIITGDPYTEDEVSLASSADYCNFKKDSAKNAQEQSIHLFLCQVINGLATSTGQLIRDAIVIQVYESAFDVLIPEFGIEKRVHGDQLPLVKAEFHKQERLLELFWEKGVDTATFVPEDERNLPSAQLATKYHASTADSAAAQDQSEIITKAISKLSAVEKAAASDSEDDVTRLSKSLPSSPKPVDVTREYGPQRTSSLSEMHSANVEETGALDAYLEGVVTRVDGDNYIQEIRVLQRVPVLVRAEVGKGIPCITVRAINPFIK
jgi:protein SSD1